MSSWKRLTCGLPCCAEKNPNESVDEKPVQVTVIHRADSVAVPASVQAKPDSEKKTPGATGSDPQPLVEAKESEPATQHPDSADSPPAATPQPVMADQLKGAASSVQNTVSSGAGQATEGAKKWDAMTEEQKKQAFDALPEDKKKGKSYYEWIKDGYHNQYENWMPWIEDQYLKWFTRDNKASYATKEGLDKTKVTGVEQVDTLQDGVNNLVAGQVGKGGLLQPIGDMTSKEGINRAERGGKDESGSVGAGGVGDSVASAGSSVAGGAKSAGGGIWSGAKSAGGYVTGMLGGGGKKEEPAK